MKKTQKNSLLNYKGNLNNLGIMLNIKTSKAGEFVVDSVEISGDSFVF